MHREKTSPETQLVSLNSEDKGLECVACPHSVRCCSNAERQSCLFEHFVLFI